MTRRYRKGRSAEGYKDAVPREGYSNSYGSDDSPPGEIGGVPDANKEDEAKKERCAAVGRLLKSAANTIDGWKAAQWARSERLLRGKQFSMDEVIGEKQGSDQMIKVIINYARPFARSIVASAFDRPIKLQVEDRRSFADRSLPARVAESLLDYFFTENEAKAELRTIVLDRVIYGYGVRHDCYRTGSEGGEGVQDYESRVKEMPYSIRVSPRDFLYDTSASMMVEAQWMARRLVYPLEYVNAREDFENKEDLSCGNSLRDATSSGSSDAPKERTGSSGADTSPGNQAYGTLEGQTMLEPVELWEVWFKKQKIEKGTSPFRRVIFAPGHDYLLMDEDAPHKDLERLPFDILQVNPDPERPIGDGDLVSWEDQQYEMNLRRSYALTLMLRNAAKILYNVNAFKDSTALRKFLSPFAMEAVPMRDVTGVKQMEPYQLRSDFWSSIQMLQDEIRVVANFYDFQNIKPRTAEEAKLIGQQLSARAKEELDLFYDFVGRMGKVWLQLAGEHFSSDLWLRYRSSGPGRAFVPFKFNRKQIHNELGVKVIPGPGRIMDDSARLEMIMRLWPMFANFVDVVNRRSLAGAVMEEALPTGHLEEILQRSPPDQVQPPAAQAGHGTPPDRFDQVTPGGGPGAPPQGPVAPSAIPGMPMAPPPQGSMGAEPGIEMML